MVLAVTEVSRRQRRHRKRNLASSQAAPPPHPGHREPVRPAALDQVAPTRRVVRKGGPKVGQGLGESWAHPQSLRWWSYPVKYHSSPMCPLVARTSSTTRGRPPPRIPARTHPPG